jgi:hypothetical protein
MGISETIVAAIIGALATMGTAIFQLIRNRAPSDGRPKPKKNRMRSVLATIALMIGCIVGGYAWSSLRAVSAKEEMRSTMEAEFTKQFAALAARQMLDSPAAGAADGAGHASGSAVAARNGDAGSAESLAQLPPCRVNAHPDAGAPTLGSLRIAETPAEHPVSADQRSVCLDVSNWSVEDTLAVRLVVEYEFGPKPGSELTAATPAAASL